MKGPCRALFSQGSPKISLAGSILGSILGSMKVQEGPLSLGRVGNDQISGPTWLEGLENIKNRKSRNFHTNPEVFLNNHKVHVRGPAGSIEGPRLVLDPMEVWSCVPRVPWNVFCCLVCKSIADTADSRWEDDCAPPRDKLF